MKEEISESINIINETRLKSFLEESVGREINKAMIEAAEPIIQGALKDIERTMRERMAAMLISFISHDFSVERFQNEVRIIVKQAANTGSPVD